MFIPLLHQHILYPKRVWLEDAKDCKVCHTSIDGPSYCCGSCNFHIHEVCAQLILQPQNFIDHHHDTLTLHYATKKTKCSNCNDSHGYNYYYKCEKCEEYYLHIRCVLSKDLSIVCKHHYDGDHGHPLALFKLNEFRKGPCGLCQLPSSKSDSCHYICLFCKAEFHLTCAQLPQKIRHPSHPDCPLSLVPCADSQKEIKCKACCKDFSGKGPYLSCETCQFHIHPECAKLLPSIKYEDHEHPLTLFDTAAGIEAIVCHVCSKPSDGLIYRCVRCNYSIHKGCLRLQQSIWQRSIHHHPLNFNLCLAEDPSDELYCDVCEEKRGPDEPVYSCKVCPGGFVSHVDCSLNAIHQSSIAAKELSSAGGGQTAIGYRDITVNEIIKLGKEDSKYDAPYPALISIDRKVAQLHREFIELDRKLENILKGTEDGECYSSTEDDECYSSNEDDECYSSTEDEDSDDTSSGTDDE